MRFLIAVPFIGILALYAHELTELYARLSDSIPG